jgi:hypothetical protein
MKDIEYPTSIKGSSRQTDGIFFRAIVCVLLGLLIWGWMTQKSELFRVQSELHHLRYTREAMRTAQQTVPQSTDLSELRRLREQQAEKEFALRNALTRLSPENLEELKWLYVEHQKSQELIEFVKSRNGSFKLAEVTPEWMQEFLGENAFTQVTEVKLRISDPESDLERLSHYKTIRAIEIGHGPLTTQAISYLKKLPRLESLHLEATKLVDEELIAISELTFLKKLTIHESLVTDAGLVKLGQLKRLQELRLDRTKNITDDGLGYLADLTALQSLDLHGAKVTGTGFAELASLPLEKLWLHQTQLNDEGLRHVVKLKTLKNLRFDYSRVTDAGLPLLKGLPNLRYVNTGRNLSDSAIRSLGAALPRVRFDP